MWAGNYRGGDALRAFSDMLGDDRCKALELVTLDMAGGYIAGVEERLPPEIVFEHFDVQRVASEALDRVCRQLWRELRGTDSGDVIKKSRYSLLKNPWNLSVRERDELSDVQRNNRPIYRAYLLKEMLANALAGHSRGMARRWLAYGFAPPPGHTAMLRCRTSKLQPAIKRRTSFRVSHCDLCSARST